MKKIVLTILFMIGLALLLTAISAWVFPGWLDIPGGWLALFGIAFIAVAAIGGGLKDWLDIFSSKKATSTIPPEPTHPPAHPPSSHEGLLPASAFEGMLISGERAQIATGEHGRNIQTQEYTEIRIDQITIGDTFTERKPCD